MCATGGWSGAVLICSAVPGSPTTLSCANSTPQARNSSGSPEDVSPGPCSSGFAEVRADSQYGST